jgi:DNA-binding NarL/FixJ family response regulator
MVTRTRPCHPICAVAPTPETDGSNRDPALLAAELVTALESALLAARRLCGALDNDRAGVGNDPARGALCASQPTGGGPPCRSALSRREAEVLRLLVAGRSNRAIAATLFVSPRTVQRHVANVYAKIGAHNKAEATAFALRHHLG